MHAISKRFTSLSSLTFFVAFVLASWCAPVQGAIKPVGEVILANGTFLAIQSDSSSRSLTRGSEFYQGDRLWTGPTTKAQVRFSDGAIMTLRADTEFRVDEYEFDSKNKGRNKSLFTLVKGGFRTITGLISRLKPESYRVKTSYAVVGVRGTTYETVVDNALYVAAWQGTVSVTNDAGETTLGFGQDTNFARVSGANRRPVTLLEAPPQLLESVDPALQEFVRHFQEVLEILPSEANLVRQGFAVFGGKDSTVSPLTAPMIGAGGTDSDGSTVIVDPSTGQILRQGAAGLVANASPLPGVSWGAWDLGPVEVQTLAGTTPVARPVFWLTMAPPTSIPTGGSLLFTNVISQSASGTSSPIGSPIGTATSVSALSLDVNFGTGSVFGGVTVTNASQGENWGTTVLGSLTGSSFSANVVPTSLINGTLGRDIGGSVVGGLTGPGAGVMGAVFDFEETGNTANHVEGVFVATP